MRVLWVKANKILPAQSGGDIRSFNMLRQLAQRHEVIFFSYYDGPRDLAYESELQRQLPGAACVCTHNRRARTWDYLLRFRNPIPYAVSRFSSDIVRDTLQRCLSEKHPDVIICDFLDAAINLPGSLNIPAILFQHNVESEIWRRHANNGTGAAMKIVYRREFRKMLRYEEEAMGRFAHVVAVSDHDKKLMSAWVPPERISVVSTGVNIEQFSPGEPREEKPLVVFVGAMDWEPNIDAAKYFCAEIWPAILGEVPDARFRIVGRNPVRRIRDLAAPAVEITGTVSSIVEHLQQAAVVVVPLRIGGGTRLKIYEAMATGKPVVSTSVGAEGLDVHPGEDLILADTPQAFAESVISLLKDAGGRQRVGRLARATASQYAWPVIAEQFAGVLRRVTEGHLAAR